MARRSTLRASDADRERIADRLRSAAGEGRLLASELEERIGAVFSARTYGELDGLVADLPVPGPRRRHATPLALRAALVLAAALAALAVAAIVTLLFIGIAGAFVAWMAVMWAAVGRAGWGRRMGCSRHMRWEYRRRPESARTPGGGPISL